MRPKKVVLLVDADPIMRGIRALVMSGWGYEVREADGVSGARLALKDGKVNAIVAARSSLAEVIPMSRWDVPLIVLCYEARMLDFRNFSGLRLVTIGDGEMLALRETLRVRTTLKRGPKPSKAGFPYSVAVSHIEAVNA
jgi:hypothetical protein